MLPSITSLVTYSIDNRWVNFSSKKPLFNDILKQLNWWGWLVYAVFKRRELKQIIKTEIDKRKNDLLPKLQEYAKKWFHLNPKESFQKIRSDVQFKIFKDNELVLVSLAPELSQKSTWRETKEFYREAIEEGRGIDFNSLRKSEALDPASEIVARAKFAVGYHPELEPTLPKRVRKALNQEDLLKEYFVRRKQELLPAIAQAIPLLKTFKALRSDPRFYVYTDYELRLFFYSKRIPIEAKPWLQYRDELRLALFEDHHLNLLSSLLTLPKSTLTEMTEYFSGNRDSVQDPEQLDLFVRASIAIRLFPEFYPLFHRDIQTVFKAMENSDRIAPHFEQLIQSSYAKLIPKSGESISQMAREVGDVDVAPQFRKDEERSGTIELQINDGPALPINQHQNLLGEINALSAKHQLNREEKHMVQLLLSQIGYGTIGGVKITLLTQCQQPLFIGTTNSGISISVQEQNNGNIEFRYSYESPVLDAETQTRSVGNLQFSYTFTMQKDPAGRYLIDGPFCDPISFSL